MQDPGGNLELQPLYSVAVMTARSVALAAMTSVKCDRADADGAGSRAVAALERALDMLEDTLQGVRRHRATLDAQLASIGGGLITASQLERELLCTLGVLHTWAATPEGAYCGGRVDETHTAAGKAAFSAALELADGGIGASGLLCGLSNLLRRTGAVAEAEAAMRRSATVARAAGDALFELNAAAALSSITHNRAAWQYGEVAALVADMHRCLKQCKPWLLSPVRTIFQEVHPFFIVCGHSTTHPVLHFM